MKQLGGRVCSVGGRSVGSIDPAAADDAVSLVTDNGLAGCDALLWDVKLHVQALICHRSHGRWHGLTVAVAEFVPRIRSALVADR